MLSRRERRARSEDCNASRASCCRRAFELIAEAPLRAAVTRCRAAANVSSHRVEHAAFALQQHERGQRAGVGIVRRLEEMQRDRPVGALRYFRTNASFCRSDPTARLSASCFFDNHVGTPLIHDRVGRCRPRPHRFSRCCRPTAAWPAGTGRQRFPRCAALSGASLVRDRCRPSLDRCWRDSSGCALRPDDLNRRSRSLIDSARMLYATAAA